MGFCVLFPHRYTRHQIKAPFSDTLFVIYSKTPVITVLISLSLQVRNKMYTVLRAHLGFEKQNFIFLKGE